MNDRELARAAHDEDSWLRETVVEIDTPEFRADLLAHINAIDDNRELITRKMIAQMRAMGDDE